MIWIGRGTIFYYHDNDVIHLKEAIKLMSNSLNFILSEWALTPNEKKLIGEYFFVESFWSLSMIIINICGKVEKF